jgi:1,4-dihydroxy-2-naphthoate octaprenyltransferase
LMAYLSIAIGATLGLLPVSSLIAMLTAPLAWRTYRGVRQNAEDIPGLVPSMGMNVIINLATPFLLAIGLFIGYPGG